MEVLKTLIHLAYQFGPFAFALIFLFLMARWGQKKWQEACTRTAPQATSEEQRTYLGYFIGVTVIGIALVAVSVVWWWTHQPVYFYEGQIDELSETESVEGPRFFVRNEYYSQQVEGPQVRDVHFLIVQNEPFTEGQAINLRYYRDRRLSKPLTLSVGPEKRGNFALHWDEANNKWKIRKKSASIKEDSGFITSAYAQTDRVAPTAREASRIEALGVRPSTSFSSAKELPVASEYEVIVRQLQDYRALVSQKIEILDKLNGASRQELDQLFASQIFIEPLFVSLMDLTRHTDKELASKAARSLQKASLPTRYFAAALSSKDTNVRSSAINYFLRLDPKYADLLLSELAKQKVDITLLSQVSAPGNHWKLLVPTGTVSGDKYYVKVDWEQGDSKATQCLLTLFNSTAGTGGTFQDSYLKSKTEGYAFDNDKERILRFAASAEKCGGKTAFVGFYPSHR